ncbi:glycosyltransferase [Planococcus donghaensis]|uniref:glycosyltransferase n=1 Tax=Planococcus donghaensis TaxID=414778 RepID=UPI0037368BC5
MNFEYAPNRNRSLELQVLVSAMHQSDFKLVEKMNIKSDAIVINQCNTNRIEEFAKDSKYLIKFISLSERGVGLSRNTALMRASADICVIADEDLTYVDNYKDIILGAFEENSNADMIMFNVPSNNLKRPTYKILKNERVRWYNCLRYGAVKIAIRTDRLKEANVYFSLLFGGGARYSHGEDSLFVANCIRKGLKVYTNTSIIGYVSQESSSWFNGYDDKFFIDKGALYYSITKKFAWLLSLQFCIRHKKMFSKDRKWITAYKLMLTGIEGIKNNK